MAGAASRRARIAILLVAACVVALAASRPEDAVWGTDEGNRRIQLAAFEREGIGSLAIPSPAGALDPEGRFFPRGGRHFQRQGESFVSFYAPWLSGLTHLVWGRHAGSARLILPLLGGIVAAFLAGRLARRIDAPEAPAIVLAALGTPLAFYSATFWEHAPAAALTAGAALLLIGGTPRSLVAGGALLGLATVLREEGWLVAAGAIMATALIRRSVAEAARVAAGCVVILLPLSLANIRLYGSWLGLHGVSYGAADFSAPGHGLLDRLGNVGPYLLEQHPDASVRAMLAGPWILLAALGAVGGIGRLPRARALALALVAASSAAGAILLGLAPDVLRVTLWTQGLLPGVPLLAAIVVTWREWIGLAPGGATVPARPADAARFLALTGLLAAGAIVLALNRDDFGIIWGPRHFVPVLVLLVPLAVLAMGRLVAAAPGRAWRRMTAGACALLVASSLAIQGLGASTLIRKDRATARLVAAIRDAGADAVVTDVYWLAEETSPLFFEQRLLEARSGEDLLEAVETCRRNGLQSVLFVTSREFGAAGVAARNAVATRATSVQHLGFPRLGMLDVALVSIAP